MTATVSIPSKFLNMDDLKLLSRHAGPCVTVSIPGFQPGAGAGTRHAHLRHLTQTAADHLGHLNRPEADEMTTARELLAGSLDDGHGGPAMTLFCAPGFTASYETPGVRADNVTVGDRFDLLPLLTAALIPSRFFVLGVSRNRIRLFHFADGPSVGGLRGVRFASTGDRDSEAVHMRHFLGLVDRGLKETLNGEPLFLAGVQEELSLYRKTAKYSHIFESECHGKCGAFNARSSGQARSRRSDEGISSGRRSRAEGVA
jgi:hypothetical protein